MKRSARVAAVVSAFAALCASVVVAVPQAEAAPRRIVSGWIPYWTTAASVQSLKSNADLFSDVSPFWHSSTSETTVTDQDTEADRSTVIAAARAAGIPVVPAVTDGTGAGYMAAVMADSARRAMLVGTLVNLVTSRGYDGLDLDYEGFAYRDGKGSWAATRPNWVQFVAELGAELRARGKVLFATIPPTYDSNRAAGSGYWVYDYAGIAPHVNRVRIMAYDYSVSAAGPIAPYDWVRRIASYAVTQVPSGKVVLGVPTYGRDWVVPALTVGTCPASADLAKKSYPAAQARQVAVAQGATVTWDAVARESRFDYQQWFADATSSCLVTRRVYFSDAAAVLERARLVGEFVLAGVALWTVGGEDPAQWAALRDYSNAIAPIPTRLTLEGGGWVAPGSTGWLYARLTAAGASVADQALSVQRRAANSSTWEPVGTVVTGPTGWAAVPVTGTANAYYRVRFWGDFANVGSVSPEVRVLVPTVVATSASPPVLPAGGWLWIWGRLTPARPAVVSLQEGTPVGWRTIATTTSTADGAVGFPLRSKAGAVAYRLQVSADAIGDFGQGADVWVVGQ